jgi:hypothetical protein
MSPVLAFAVPRVALIQILATNVPPLSTQYNNNLGSNPGGCCLILTHLSTGVATTTGSIEAAELAPLLRTLKVPCSEEELLLLVAEMDSDKSGDVDYEEFEAWYVNYISANKLLSCTPSKSHV